MKNEAKGERKHPFEGRRQARELGANVAPIRVAAECRLGSSSLRKTMMHSVAHPLLVPDHSPSPQHTFPYCFHWMSDAECIFNIAVFRFRESPPNF
jgi:hypothetical protein